MTEAPGGGNFSMEPEHTARASSELNRTHDGLQSVSSDSGVEVPGGAFGATNGSVALAGAYGDWHGQFRQSAKSHQEEVGLIAAAIQQGVSAVVATDEAAVVQLGSAAALRPPQEFTDGPR